MKKKTFYFGYLKQHFGENSVLFPASVRGVLIVQTFVAYLVLVLDNNLVVVSSFRSQSKTVQF